MRILATLSVLDRKLLRELWRIRSQVLAIASVIGAGLALFVLMMSTLVSLEETRRAYYERYRFAEVFAQLERAPERVAGQIEQIPGVDVVRTRVVVGVNLDLQGSREPASGLIVSIPEIERPMLNDLYLRQGRYIEPRRDEVLASEGFVEANGLEPGDAITAVINGRKRTLTLVGVALSPEFTYNIRPGEFLPDEKNYGVFWMGRESLAAAYDMQGAFNDVVLTVSPEASLVEVVGRLDRLLEPYGGLGAFTRADQASHWYLENELTQLRSMGTVVPLIFLTVAAFLLNIVLTRIVTVQRQEIAAVKAVGYSNRELAWHYIKWSLVVASLGVVLGVGFGALLGRGMTAMYVTFFHFPILLYQLPGVLVVQAFFIAAGSGVLGALTAVKRAVDLPPAEAMRPEPPPTFRQSWFDRLGVRRLLSQPTRIILRNLQRTPTRAAISVVGIAAGGALMILGSFTLDAVNVLMDFQFNVAQRQDLSVYFYRPSQHGVVHELSRLPGVVEVEPLRSVRVRLQNGHRHRNTGMDGVAADARLQRMVDLESGPITIPPEGVVLSRVLADVLRLAPGDRVEVQVLEGRRTRGTLVVTKVIDDLMGTAAYMDSEALHRFLEEGPNASGALLRVDPVAAESLYQRLKGMPNVSAVVRKQAAIDSFDQAMGETMGTVRAINVLFAVIIGFGVVYNAARISLSERGRELATLRVIGFRRSEISYILLGEIAALTVVALPLSLVAGYLLARATADGLSTEAFRIPLIVSPRTYFFAGAVVVLSTVLSSIIVRRRLDHLDLVAVLKTRE